MKTIMRVALAVSCTSLLPVSFVYNLRIAETTRRQTLQQHEDTPSVFGSTLIGQFRKTYNGISESIIGDLYTFIYTAQSNYFKIDFAAARAKATSTIFNSYVIQWDDILFTAGHGITIGDQVKISGSALFGVPTHKDRNLEELQFGIGHVSLGIQGDCAYNYSANRNHFVMSAIRFIHFFPRSIDLCIAHQKEQFDLGLGNVLDILISHYSRWKHHALEIGYNPEFGRGAHINPPLDDIPSQINFTRNSFYGAYEYLFIIKNKFPSAFIAGFSYSFDSEPKTVGIKNGYTVWATWGLKF